MQISINPVFNVNSLRLIPKLVSRGEGKTKLFSNEMHLRTMAEAISIVFIHRVKPLMVAPLPEDIQFLHPLSQI